MMADGDVRRVIGYVRVSTAGQAEEGVSMDAQQAKIRAWALLAGTEDVRIFSDAGISGSRMKNRPGLQAALAEVGKGDALVVYSLSRLSRSVNDTITLSEQLAKRGADLVSLSERIDTTTAAGKMVFRMLAVLNEFERDQISDRTCEAMHYKRSKGEKTGGAFAPFGYQAADGMLIPDEGERQAVELVKRLRGEGASLRQIGKRLEAEGIRRKGGAATWPAVAVKRIVDRQSVTVAA